MERLIGARTIADLKNRILPAGLRDVQDWMDVSIQFRRRGATGWADVGVAVDVISIHLAGNQPLEALGNVETTTRGTAKVFLHDVSEDMPQPNDRFTWNGHICTVDLVAPNRLETWVGVEFTLLEN